MPPQPPSYDVFLCHNSPEEAAAAWLEARLRGEGIRGFLDQRHLVPGTSLPAEIPDTLMASGSCAVLLGPSGIGGWQRLEIDIAVERAVREEDTFRIIVLTLPGANLGDLPPVLNHRLRIHFSSGIEDPAAFRVLLDGIRGIPRAEHDTSGPLSPPPYRSMAPRASGFVERSELATVLRALTTEAPPASLNAGPTTVALTTALRGAGGFGKTALAQAVCANAGVHRHFPAGILWARFGEHFTQADRLSRVIDLLRWWTRKEPPAYDTLDAAAAALRNRLSGQPVLLVVDDVWLAADVEPFLGLEPPATLLLTTRYTRAIPPTARSIVVDALELPRAIELLGQDVAAPLPRPALERLTRRLGEWPILLRLVNAQLREEYRGGLHGEAALRVVERELDAAGLTAFDREDEVARELAVRRTVEASLRRLPPADRQRYGQLAVFAEDQEIPLSVLEALWGAGGEEVHRLCRRLFEMSLLYSFDPVAPSIQLHDVMRAYLLREHRDALETFHRDLVDRYADARRAGAAQADLERYFVSWLPFHLKEGCRNADLEQLLFSYDWLETKVVQAGVNAAIADYQLLSDDQDASRLQQALRLSRTVLTHDARQLAGHLHGRLSSAGSPRIAALLLGANAAEAGPWLRPLLASFAPPSGLFEFTIHAHRGEVRAIAQLDRERFATSGTDGEVRVWDFDSGELRAVLPAAGCPVRHLVALSPARLLAGGDDGVVRLLDLEQEELVRAFPSHGSAVTALRARGDDFLSGEEDGTLQLWSLASGQPHRTFQGHDGKINDVGFLDQRTIVSIGKDRTLRVWNTVGTRQLRAATIAPFGAQRMEVTGSNEVILATFAGEIQVWKPQANPPERRRSLRHPAVGIEALCVLRRDLGASSIGGQPTIQLWNPQTCALGNEVHVPGNGVTALARFDRSHLLCGSEDGSVSVLTVERLEAQSTGTPTASVYALAPIDDATIASTTTRGIRVWKVPDPVPVRELTGHADLVTCVCTLDTERVASSSADATIRIWNPHTGELVKTLECGHKLGALAALAPNLLLAAPLAGTGTDQQLQLWEVAAGLKLVDLASIPGGVAVLRSIEGRFLLVGTYGGIVLRMDLSPGLPDEQRNLVLTGHERGVTSLAVLDRDHIASGSLDTTIRIWNLASQQVIRILEGHTKEVMGLAALSANLLLSASADHSLRIWDVRTGGCLATLELDTSLSSLALMPDGRTLVAGDVAGRVHFLRLEGVADPTR